MFEFNIFVTMPVKQINTEKHDDTMHFILSPDTRKVIEGIYMRQAITRICFQICRDMVVWLKYYILVDL